MSKNDPLLLDNLDKNILKDIKDLYNKIKSSSEFELILFNYNKLPLTLEKYINLIRFLTNRNKANNMKIILSNTLDINYSYDGNINYRITINNIENINNNIEQLHRYKNHVIFSTLIKKYINGDKNIVLLQKIKEKENVVDINEYNIRVRLSEENIIGEKNKDIDFLSKLPHTDINKINFRLKQRLSFFVFEENNKNGQLKIDLSITKMSKNMNQISKTVPNYEAEIEVIYGNKLVDIATIFKEAELLLKVIEQNNYIITSSKKLQVLDHYAKIMNEKKEFKYLNDRKPRSLEVYHTVDIIPDKYAVTDKADGERNFLIIMNKEVFIISENLHVKYTGITLKDNKYDDSIMDGEYIFLTSHNRYIFMVFDCLFISGEDIRNKNNLFDRLEMADEIISHCFVLGKQNGFKFKEYKQNSKEFNLNNIILFHEKQLYDFIKTLNEDIKLEKKFPLIRRKYFIGCYGAVPWEIFRYSVLLWEKYTLDPNINIPYMLDGLVYHPLVQAYTTNDKDIKLYEYKWKPPEKNSIDFYITFEKDKDTGKILTVYDNSIDAHVNNKTYKICKLHVGERGKYNEEPVLFKEEEERYICNLFLNGNDVYDLEGNLITDNSVVEFYYKNDPDLDERFRWIPIRTRYDKTEAVQRYKQRYGNYIDTANRIWGSIINPVLMTDFSDLAKGNDVNSGNYYYDIQIEKMRRKIGHQSIISAVRENVYFQVKTNLAKPMRQFHNWIKSITMYTYFNEMYQNGNNMAILDIAVGKGEDIMRYYYTKVSFMVGLDIDQNALLSAIDGAVSRYEKFKKSYPAFPKMTFIRADAGALLDYENQNKALKGMSIGNKTNFEKFFSSDPNKRTLFDGINCQFALHYFLKDNDSWTNFKKNINNYLKDGGYFVFTVLDAQRIIELFKNLDQDVYTIYYTDSKGDKKKLLELIKKFPDFDKNDKITTGNALDVFMAWIFQEGNYQTEYLVDKDFIINELRDDCNLELLDTDFFDNMMEMQKKFLLEYYDYEEDERTRQFMKNVNQYYINDNINMGCYYYTRLYRFYAFRKKNKINSVMKGGSSTLFFNDPLYIINQVKSIDYTACDSIFNIIKNHKLVPLSLSAKQFYNDLHLDYKNDNDIDKNYFKNVSNNIHIIHDIGQKKVTILHGINIIITDIINNNYHFDIIKSNKATKYIIIIKENNNYKPLFRKEEHGLKAIFNSDDELIKKIMLL